MKLNIPWWVLPLLMFSMIFAMLFEQWQRPDFKENAGDKWRQCNGYARLEKNTFCNE